MIHDDYELPNIDIGNDEIRLIDITKTQREILTRMKDGWLLIHHLHKDTYLLRQGDHEWILSKASIHTLERLGLIRKYELTKKAHLQLSLLSKKTRV